MEVNTSNFREYLFAPKVLSALYWALIIGLQIIHQLHNKHTHQKSSKISIKNSVTLLKNRPSPTVPNWLVNQKIMCAKTGFSAGYKSKTSRWPYTSMSHDPTEKYFEHYCCHRVQNFKMSNSKTSNTVKIGLLFIPNGLPNFKFV